MKMPVSFGDLLPHATMQEVTKVIVLERKLDHYDKLMKKYKDCQAEIDVLVAEVKARVEGSVE